MQIERLSFSEGNSICRASYDGKLGVLLGRDLTNVWGKWGKMGNIIARAKFHVAWLVSGMAQILRHVDEKPACRFDIFNL